MPDEIYINGQRHGFSSEQEDMPLLWYLRDILGLTGTKYGCGIGACGCCMVLIDDDPVQSCVVPVKSLIGKVVVTIEGLSEDNSHPVQKTWEAEQVPQCGYCQSGQIINAVALLKKHKNPDEEVIKQHMSSVLCRCGTYPRILQAIKAVSRSS